MNYDLIEKLSGVEQLEFDLKDVNPEFVAIVEKLISVHAGKSLLYGDYIDNRDEKDSVAIFEHYNDIKRKFIRVENFYTRTVIGEQVDIKELIDTYTDLAVYSILGLQLIFHIMEKDNAQRADDGAEKE